MSQFKTVKLGELVKIRTGKLDANASSDNGAYPFFTCSREPLKIATYSYDCKCVLVAGNGDLNVKYYEGKFDAYQRTYIIESLDESKLDTRYLYYFLAKYVDKLRELSIGGVIKYIKLNNLTDPQIPLPSLEEQERIVRELDAADALRQKRKQAIALLDDYLKTVFLEMFGDPVENPKGWEIRKFGEIIEDIRYGSSEKSANSQGDNSIPILRIPNILNGYVNYNDLKFQILAKKEEQTLTLNAGDILFVRTNGNPEYIGRCAVFNDDKKCVFASYLIRTRLKEDSEFNPFFIRYCLSMDSYRGKIRKESRTTAGNYNINTKGIKNFDLIFPPKEQQDKFIAVMAYIEKLGQSMNSQSDTLDMNFNALMQGVFNQT